MGAHSVLLIVQPELLAASAVGMNVAAGGM